MILIQGISATAPPELESYRSLRVRTKFDHEANRPRGGEANPLHSASLFTRTLFTVDELASSFYTENLMVALDATSQEIFYEYPL
jgi:hypothetical protein